MSFIASKTRTFFGSSGSSSSSSSSTTNNNTPAADRQMRPFSMASSVTVVPPSPLAPTYAQPSTLATLQYQRDLIGDFWSGSAARTPCPPPLARAPSPPPRSSYEPSHSHESSVGSAGGKKTKWANAVRARAGAGAGVGAGAGMGNGDAARAEPKTSARWLFILGFLCPLLWFVGAIILFVPTTPHIEMASLPVHSTQERERRVALYRKAEAKWAKRCLWALVALLGIVTVVVVAAVLAVKSSS